VSVRVVATPLIAPFEWPVPRSGTIDPGLLEAFVPASGTEALRARLQEPGALVVTTGQQPGLFTGPLYTVHKALSAAALARVLERRWGRPVVPVFWIAGDDHDFAEASHASWLTADGDVATGALPPRRPDAPSTPLYRETLGPAVDMVLAELAAGLAPSEFGDPTVTWLRRHFRPEATMAASVGGALAELLAPAGVLCLESTHPCMKRAALPHLLRALDLAEELNATLHVRARELEAAGHDPGVEVVDGATLVMIEGALGRDRLIVDDGGFVARRSGERFDAATLRQIALRAPERLSPNVLLRPVVESALLPTVAYVAGPAELRYLELAASIYDRLGVPRQRPVPRWSGLLVERRVDRVLEKFGIALGELLAPAGPLEARLVRAQLPAEATEALAELRAAIDAQYEIVTRAAEAIDPTLARPLERIRAQALAGADAVEQKLVRHLKRRQETELGQLAKARAAVFPNGKPQERVLTVAPFLARYGPALVPMLADEFERWYTTFLPPEQP
jgi:bacillithiol biosynthesis cysteine-adding enzyme BshC